MAELAVRKLYVVEYSRVTDHPWVDFITRMYHEGTAN